MYQWLYIWIYIDILSIAVCLWWMITQIGSGGAGRAALGVAVTDKADSLSLNTFECACWSWHFFICCCLAKHSFASLGSFPDLLPLTSRVAGTILPTVCNDAFGLHVLLANIFESLVLVARSPNANNKLSVQKVLGEPPIYHAVDMTEPSKAPLWCSISIHLSGITFSFTQPVKQVDLIGGQ